MTEERLADLRLLDPQRPALLLLMTCRFVAAAQGSEAR
jgi:hypothetical protein